MKKKRPFLEHFFSLKAALNMPITTTKNNINKRKRNDFEKNEDDSDDKGQFDVSVLLPGAQRLATFNLVFTVFIRTREGTIGNHRRG